MAYQALLGKVSSASVRRSLEDVLTATVFGTISYAPPELARPFLREFARTPVVAEDPVWEFWPTHQLESGKSIQPDVFLRLNDAANSALIIEAKQRAALRSGQLRDEADAARASHPEIGPLYLLTVSDEALTPSATAKVTGPGRRYASARHVAWTDLYAFLEPWVEVGSGLDAGGRRMVRDALAVMRRYDREPFRRIGTKELRRMERETAAMYELPTRIHALHVRLERSLGELVPPLYLNETERVVFTDGGSRAIDRPDSWLPRALTLPYGATRKKRHGDYYFVRFRLDRPEIWIGLQVPRRTLEQALSDDPGLQSRICDVLGPRRAVAGVESSHGSPFAVDSGPVPITPESLTDVVGSSASKVNLAAVRPRRVLTRKHADEQVGRELVRLIRACRKVDGLGAP